MPAPARRLMLREALPLLVTYASGPMVELGPREVELSPDEDAGDARFADELLARHQIASALTLHRVLVDIQRRPSRSVSLERRESRGVIRGRLDISRYLARRATSVSLPRRYPVIGTRYMPDTPDNGLVRQCLRLLASSLRQSPFPAATAENLAAKQQQTILYRYLRQSPWNAVRRTGQIDRLRLEVQARVRRRQTGNDAAYRQLLQWVAEWRLDLTHLGPVARDHIVAGMLAFPTSEMFWDRIFEVWCLGQVYASLERIGMQLAEQRPLFERRLGPVRTYKGAVGVVKVHFQTQRPLGQPRWSYRAGGGLAGIPDIVLASEERGLLLIDAKNRPVIPSAPHTSEETYKMLGYAENFRELASRGLRAMLIFPGGGPLHRVLDGPSGGRLDLLVTDFMERHDLEESLDSALSSWWS